MKKLTFLAFCIVAFCNTVFAQTAWHQGGDATSGTQSFGTTNSNNIDFITNNATVGTWDYTSGDLLVNNGFSCTTLAALADANIGGDCNVTNSIYVALDLHVGQDIYLGSGGSVHADAIAANVAVATYDLTVSHITGLYDATVANDLGVTNDLSVSGNVGIQTAPNATYILDVNGACRNTTTVWASDLRYKKNIDELASVQSKLFKVLPKSYDFRIDEFKDIHFDDKKHFGFIAQELEKIYPNLVNKDDKGYYAVNYIEFIPLLLQALKEEDTKVVAMQDELKALKNEVSALKSSNTGIGTNGNTSKSVLEQNTPNPFNGSTTIKFLITEKYNHAFIGIYDYNGKQVKTLPVELGSTQAVLDRGSLSAGMYMYSLVVDNNIVDTKKMVIADN